MLKSALKSHRKLANLKMSFHLNLAKKVTKTLFLLLEVKTKSSDVDYLRHLLKYFYKSNSFLLSNCFVLQIKATFHQRNLTQGLGHKTSSFLILGRKDVTVTNIPSYFASEYIAAAKKSFIIGDPGDNV
jgi:hypothetical protein